MYMKIRISATNLVDSASWSHQHGKGGWGTHTTRAFHRSPFKHHSDKIIVGPVSSAGPHGHRTPHGCQRKCAFKRVAMPGRAVLTREGCPCAARLPRTVRAASPQPARAHMAHASLLRVPAREEESGLELRLGTWPPRAGTAGHPV